MVLESEALDPRFKASKLSPANKDTFLHILGGGGSTTREEIYMHTLPSKAAFAKKKLKI